MTDLDDLGINSMLVGLIRPHVPKIAAKILPILNDELVKILYQSDCERLDDETQSAIMLFRDKQDNIFLSVCKLSDNDRILRMSKPVQMKEYLTTLINESLSSQEK